MPVIVNYSFLYLCLMCLAYLSGCAFGAASSLHMVKPESLRGRDFVVTNIMIWMLGGIADCSRWSLLGGLSVPWTQHYYIYIVHNKITNGYYNSLTRAICSACPSLSGPLCFLCLCLCLCLSVCLSLSLSLSVSPCLCVCVCVFMRVF